LDRERIACAALALIDSKGLEGLSMRGLGQELGVEAMALYHHFKSKGELLDAVLELLANELLVPAPDATGTSERLRKYLRSHRQIAVRHPKAFILLTARRFNTPQAFEKYERILAMYAEFGLSPKEQAYWFRLFGGYVGGAGLAYVASVEEIPDATTLQLQHDPRAIQLPHVSAAAPFLRVEGLEAAFEYGLEVLLEALDRLARIKRSTGK
jgi:AcrR family transcriptional regulator